VIRWVQEGCSGFRFQDLCGWRMCSCPVCVGDARALAQGAGTHTDCASHWFIIAACMATTLLHCCRCCNAASSLTHHCCGIYIIASLLPTPAASVRCIVNVKSLLLPHCCYICCCISAHTGPPVGSSRPPVHQGPWHLQDPNSQRHTTRLQGHPHAEHTQPTRCALFQGGAVCLACDKSHPWRLRLRLSPKTHMHLVHVGLKV
jgi:hypothetical protein